MGFFKPTWVKVLTAIILVLAVVVVEVYLLGSRKNQPLSQLHPPSHAPTAIQSSPAYIQPFLSPFPTSSGQTTIIPGWKTYTNQAVGYSIQAPSQWFVQQYAPIMSIEPKSQIGPEEPDYAGVVILSPIAIQGPHQDIWNKQYEHGLQGLEQQSPFSLGPIKEIFYTEIEGRRTLITKSISAVNPPPNFDGSWCSECTEKNVYIDLGNGSILTIRGFWQKGAIVGFENTFDQITSTLKFIN